MKNVTRLAAALPCLLAIVTASPSIGATYSHRWTVFPENSGVKVAASVPQLARVARSIGEKHVAVVSLLKSSDGVKDPKLCDRMVKTIREADVVVRLSPDLDPYIEELIKKAGDCRVSNKAELCCACLAATARNGQNQDLKSLLANPSNMETAARGIFAALVKADPADESYYQARLDAYLQSLKISTARRIERNEENRDCAVYFNADTARLGTE